MQRLPNDSCLPNPALVIFLFQTHNEKKKKEEKNENEKGQESPGYLYRKEEKST
jgi:hypothetical protein